MQDPHVKSMSYLLKTSELLSFQNSPPVECDTDAFCIRLADDLVIDTRPKLENERDDL